MTMLAGRPVAEASDTPRVVRDRHSGADRLFRLVVASGSLALLGASLFIAGYLGDKGLSALRSAGFHLLTSDRWSPASVGTQAPSYGIGGDLFGSFVIAVIALIVAVPVGVATALLINEYLPPSFSRSCVALLDLLATVPGIVFGLWGVVVLDNHFDSTARWLSHYAGFIPIFRNPGGTFGQGLFISGIVVGIMILPVIASISREVMGQAPRDVFEAALALGGTRWGAITEVILPFARNGIIGGALLGFGRALGETIAVVLILANDNLWTTHLLGPFGGSVAALIAETFTTTRGPGENALTLAGLLLLITTFIVSLGARAVLGRGHRSAR
jgi:phosphate transport system permease protein